MLAIPEHYGGFCHNHCSDPDSDCRRLLGSTPAIQWYKVRPCCIKAEEIAVFCGQNHYSSPGDCLLDGRLLHNCWTDCESVDGQLLGLTPAVQPYRGRLCLKTDEVAVFCGGCIRYSAGHILLDDRLLYNWWTDFHSECGRLLGLTPASQRYKVRLCRIKTDEIAVICGGCIRYEAGDVLLDGRLLHDCRTDFSSVYGRLLGSTPASQRYKVRFCRIKTHNIAVCCRVCIRYQAGIFYSIAYYSMTARRILIPFAGGCWARHQLRNGIRFIPPRPLFMKLQGAGLGGDSRGQSEEAVLEWVFCQKAAYEYRCFYMD